MAAAHMNIFGVYLCECPCNGLGGHIASCLTAQKQVLIYNYSYSYSECARAECVCLARNLEALFMILAH